MLSVRVAGPCVTVQNDVFIFIGQLAAALMTLDLTLGALIAVLVTYGLRPLATDGPSSRTCVLGAARGSPLMGLPRSHRSSMS